MSVSQSNPNTLSSSPHERTETTHTLIRSPTSRIKKPIKNEFFLTRSKDWPEIKANPPFILQIVNEMPQTLLQFLRQTVKPEAETRQYEE